MSAVECFLGGVSPYFVEGLGGNVLEWTRSLYAGLPYQPDDGREDLEADGSRVLRGGAFYFAAWVVRCAFRDVSDPDSWNFNLYLPGNPLKHPVLGGGLRPRDGD